MKTVMSAVVAAAVLLGPGCGKRGGGAAGNPSAFHPEAPHGGTVVALSDDYNVELVRDGAAGVLSAYLLDDDLENFIRSPARSLTLVATGGGQNRTLVLDAVPNPATGETVGDTSLFQGRADWLRTVARFDGRILAVPIHGETYASPAFRFP